MLPIIIKEGIVILIAGAMLVAGSINTYKSTEHDKKVVYQVKNTNEKIRDIEEQFEEFQKEYIDWYLKDNDFIEQPITKENLKGLKELSLESYMEHEFEDVEYNDKMVEVIFNRLPRKSQDRIVELSFRYDGDFIINEYLKVRFNK